LLAQSGTASLFTMSDEEVAKKEHKKHKKIKKHAESEIAAAAAAASDDEQVEEEPRQKKHKSHKSDKGEKKESSKAEKAKPEKKATKPEYEAKDSSVRHCSASRCDASCLQVGPLFILAACKCVNQICQNGSLLFPMRSLNAALVRWFAHRTRKSMEHQQQTQQQSQLRRSARRRRTRKHQVPLSEAGAPMCCSASPRERR
jgi:hypothetical protein